MKECPTCGKEFEDSLKFCQIDGVELVEQEAAFDPYATVVGYKFDPSAETPVEASAVEGPSAEASVEETAAGESIAPAEPAIHETTGSIPIGVPDEVLEVPGLDPLKTMYVSPMELKEVLGEDDANAEEQVTKVAEAAPPPSPFSVPEFADPKPSAATASAQFGDRFPASETDWTPPPAPVAEWQNQGIGSSSSSGAGGENKTLAIISLVCGILSLICCSWFIPAIAAIVVGFIARGKANSDPANYGGAGLAMGGIITGAISILVGIVVVILYMLGAFAGAIGSGF